MDLHFTLANILDKFRVIQNENGYWHGYCGVVLISRQ
jgi:hypothetical protein